MKLIMITNKHKQAFLYEQGIKPISADMYIETPKFLTLLESYQIQKCFYNNNKKRRK